MTNLPKTQLVTKLTTAEVALAHERHDLDLQIKKLMSERDALDEKIRLRMERTGAHIATFRGAIVVEMRPWTRRTLDARRLRLEQPAIAEQYERESSGMALHYA